MNSDRSVRVTSYGLAVLGSITSRGRYFSSRHLVQTGPWPT